MNLSESKVLLVDDEPDILEFLGYNLQKEGCEVNTVNNGMDAIRLAEQTQPHLIVLDVMMPGMDGIETCEKLRSIPMIKNSIIVFLTARAEGYSQIAGFDVGGDDYITKPVRPKVFITRVKALLRRYGGMDDRDENDQPNIKQLGNLRIDFDKYVVYINDEEAYLPKKEFNLLVLLTSKPSKVFTREEIFNRIWGSDVFVGDRTIDVYIRKLREKVGEKHIKTVKGIGYKYEV